jgi:hypothetical protein
VAHIQRRLLCAAVILLGVAPVLALQTVTIHALAQNPDQFDGKVVSVVGSISDYRELLSGAGNAYTNFRLTEGEASVSVFIWNKQGLSNGQKARVTGTFAKTRQVGPYTFPSEIQATRIEVTR